MTIRAVISMADDLTGATEIAAAGHRRGFSACVLNRPPLSPPQVGLLAYNTDSRLQPAAEARRSVLACFEKLRLQSGSLLYKKVDSVLRGPVLPELAALMEATGKRRALLVPANPSLGRIYRDGHAYIHGVPIHETDFANDPHHPASSSDVSDLLGPSPLPIAILRPGQALPGKGIILGEATSRADLEYWVQQIDADTLPAGAADFFDACLDRQPVPKIIQPVPTPTKGSLSSGTTQRPVPKATATEQPVPKTLDSSYAQQPVPKGSLPTSVTLQPVPTAFPHPQLAAALAGPTLVLLGSLAGASGEWRTLMKARGFPVLTLPEGTELSAGETTLQPIRQALAEHPLCLLHAPLLGDAPERRAGLVRSRFARCVKSLHAHRAFRHLIISGGSTAAAVLEELAWDSLQLRHLWAPGVASLTPETDDCLCLTLKPGSYVWPDELTACLTTPSLIR